MIIIINNKKYDVTEFINEHPGGNQVFVDGKDMTEEFNKICHSKEAIKMLEKYLIKEDKKEVIEDKKEVIEDKKEVIENNLDNISIYDFFQYKFKNSKLSKLFTHEDYLNMHKILGTITLINILYFIFDLLYSGCKGICTIRKFNYTFFILLIIQLLLSLSSLQFHIPTELNYITFSMGQEYRLHSILFSIRYILMIIVLRFINNKYISYLFILIIFISNMYFADLCSYYYKSKNNKLGLINSLPFWSNCPQYLQQSITNFYSLIQIIINYILLYNLSNIEINFMGIFVIQFTAFMLTLSRKNIINNFYWHIIYLLQFLIVFITFYNNKKIMSVKNIFIGIFLWLCRTKLNINKYFLWSCLSIITFFKKIYPNNILLFIFLIILLNVMDNYNLIFDKKREINHNIVISNKKIMDTDLHIINIKMKNNIEYKPGQYYNIYFDKEKRPYTPILFDKENNSLQFYIKDYKNNKISEKICSIKEKTFIHLEGPFGINYYDKEKDLIIYKNNPIEYENILMFYCGTGITPFYNMITNFVSNTKYKYKLFGSLHDKKERYFKLKHKIYYSNNKINIKKINKILKLYDPTKTCLLICGSESFQNLFLNIPNYNIYKW